MGAVGSHTVESDLLADWRCARDSEPALAIRALPDRVAVEWSKSSGEAVTPLFSCYELTPIAPKMSY